MSNMLTRATPRLDTDPSATASPDNSRPTSKSTGDPTSVPKPKENPSQVLGQLPADSQTIIDSVLATRPSSVNFATNVVFNPISTLHSTATNVVGTPTLTPSIFSNGGLTPLTLLPNGTFAFAGSPLIYSPSTFASLEQTLLHLERQQRAAVNPPSTKPVEVPSSVPASVFVLAPNTVASAAMPPTMSIKREHEGGDSDDYSDDGSNSGADWTGTPPGGNGSGRFVGDSAVDYSVTSPGYSSTDSGSAKMSSANGAKSTRRATGPRRRNNNIKLTPEEEERRKMRRERNKYAAAKCRQKRVDQTNELLEETQSLEAEQSRLNDEIKTFQQEKEELEFILEAHRLHCGIRPTISAAAIPNQTIYAPVVKVEGAVNSPLVMISQATSAQQTIAPVRPTMAPPVTHVKRPSSFVGPSIVSSSNGVMSVSSVGGIAGNVFILGLDSMMDGHTGLTPITGMPSGPGQTPSGPTQSDAQNLSSKGASGEGSAGVQDLMSL